MISRKNAWHKNKRKRKAAGWGSAVARNDEAAVFPEQTLQLAAQAAAVRVACQASRRGGVQTLILRLIPGHIHLSPALSSRLRLLGCLHPFCFFIPFAALAYLAFCHQSSVPCRASHHQTLSLVPALFGNWRSRLGRRWGENGLCGTRREGEGKSERWNNTSTWSAPNWPNQRSLHYADFWELACAVNFLLGHQGKGRLTLAHQECSGRTQRSELWDQAQRVGLNFCPVTSSSSADRLFITFFFSFCFQFHT